MLTSSFHKTAKQHAAKLSSLETFSHYGFRGTYYYIDCYIRVFTHYRMSFINGYALYVEDWLPWRMVDQMIMDHSSSLH